MKSFTRPSGTRERMRMRVPDRRSPSFKMTAVQK